MKNRQLLKRATAIIILFAMLLPFGAKKGVLKVSAAESYVNLLIDNFEDGTIPGNQSAAVTVAGKSVYGGSYANDAFGFGKMADIGYGSKQTSTQSVKYERNFENNFAAGEANSFVEFEFDLGIYKKTMSQMTLNFKSHGKQIGYLRWNTQGGALDVHYDFADSSKKTAATSDRAKSSSATATNKIDHIKIIMQTTDSSGNPVNIFKSFIIGDVVIAPSSDIAFTSNDVINGFDLTVNPPRAGWSACDAGLNLDNLVITRYTSADGAAPAPDRYAFFKKMIEKHSEIQSARNSEKISDEEYNELISVTENAASVYAAGITRESFAAAEDALRAADSTQSVRAEVCRMYFPTREYAAENGTVTLPAGMYDAVRLTLGEGKGHNWWCVVFPPMCLGAAADEKQLGDVLSPDEERFVTGGSRYTVRFWLIEQIEELLRRFRK